MKFPVLVLVLAGACAQAATVVLAPGDGGNDTPRVAAAVEALKEGDTLVFQKGVYHFHDAGTRERYIAASSNDDGVKKFAFPLFGKRGVTVDGGGARFVFHELVYPFGLLGSTNVVLRGFTACAAMPWWGEFTVAEKTDDGFLCDFGTNGIPFTVENGRIDFKLDFGTSSSTNVYYSVHALDWCQIHYLYVGDSTASKENLATSYMAVDAESRGPWQVFFRYRNDPHAIRCPYPERRPLAVMMGGSRRKGVFFMQDCADVRVADVAIPRAVGMAFVAQMCENLALERIRIVPENGERVTTGADDVYVINCRGQVVLDGCEISHALDDAVNIHGDYTRAAAVKGRTVTARVCHQAHAGFFPYRVGDEVDFVTGDAASRSIVGHARVAAFAPPAQGALQTEIVFDREIPSAWTGALLDNVSWIPDVTIRNCSFHDYLNIRLSANGTYLIEDNRFTRGLDVVYAHDLIDYWGESGPIRGMTVRRNVCSEMAGAFFQFACPLAGPVLIEDNKIEKMNGRPLLGGVGAATVVHRGNGVDGVVFRGGDATISSGLRGIWEFFGLKGGAAVPLLPYELDGGAFKGVAWEGTTYPMAVRNTTEAARKTPPVLNVTVPAGGWVLHPGVHEPVVARFTPEEDAVRDVRLEFADLLSGDGGETAGVDVTLKIGGVAVGRATVSAERGKPQGEIVLEEQTLRKGVPLEIVVDSRGSHSCDGTGVKVMFEKNRLERIDVPGDWSLLPPKDVDPKLSDVENPVPRPWSGQKAALRFSRVVKAPGGVQVRWNVPPADAARTLRASPRAGLYCGDNPPCPGVSTPKVYTLGRSFRLFDEPPPDTEVLFPFAVIVDGNEEDGFGGYVVALDTAGTWTLDRAANRVALTTTDPAARPVVMRFDGTWLAGLQTLCARLGEVPAFAAALKARHAELVKGVDRGPDLALLLTAISEWVQDDRRWNCSADGWEAYLRGRIAKRAKLLADPRLRETLEKGVVFGTRASPSWNHCVAQYFGWRQRPGGDLLVLRRPGQTLETTNLTAGKFPRGSFLEPRLSYDARKLLFAFVKTDGAVNPRALKRNEADGDWCYYHLWTMNADGTEPKQITSGVYDDTMGEWLPDGDIVFMSTRRRGMARCFWWGYSERWHSYTLYRMGADGANLKQLSWNDVNEWHPTVGNDGLVYFARWDYIDRHAVLHQNLWSMRPDGTNPMGVWGNETAAPHCTFQPRMLPGGGKLAVIASAHHAATGGPLVILDPSVHDNSEAAVTHVTPGHYPEAQTGAESQRPGFAGDDWYNSPWPYGEDLFLVAWSRAPLHYEPSRSAPDASLGLYVLAADGTREVIYRDGRLNACAPQPFAARRTPPVWQSQLDAALAAKGLAEVFIADVYTGIPQAARGSIKAVRLVQVFPKTTVDTNSPFIGGGGEENARMVLGTATVEADGSARFLVPACRPFYFQVLDKDGFAWRTMRTSTSAMPGERMSCVGCHEGKRGAYGAAPKPGTLALKRAAEPLRTTSECGRPWGFVENLQPIFDAKCASCHSGANAKGGIVLTREIDPRFGGQFTKAFATLCFADDAKGWPPGAPRRIAKNGREMVANYKQRDNVQTTPEGPGVNALGSGLIAHLRSGEHAGRVTAEELRLIGTWIDLNATFYGCYEHPGLSAQREGRSIPPPACQ